MNPDATTLIIGLGLVVLAGLTGAAAIRGALSANRNRTLVFGAAAAILVLAGVYVTAGALFRMFLG